MHIGGSRVGGGGGGLRPPFRISKIKESNKTKQKMEDGRREKGNFAYMQKLHPVSKSAHVNGAYI